MVEKIIIVLVILAFMWGLVWALSSVNKQATSDWKIVHDIEARANAVTTKEEIEALHKELVQAGNKMLHNRYTTARLRVVQAYLKGLYKQFN